MYPYGLIGNGQSLALVSEQASIDWLCWPRPDSPPLFGRLLDEEGGYFSIEAEDLVSSRQEYQPNTNVLRTYLRTTGGECMVTDFCPRFEQFGRMYRPASLFRIIEPISGACRVKVSCRPVEGWSRRPVAAIRGNSHVRYQIGDEVVRLTMDCPLTHVLDGRPFLVAEPVHFALTWGSPLEDDLPKVTREFLAKTEAYWLRWVKHCSIPAAYQKETIRSALTLKLHCYEDTGAIFAAPTTSLPEEPGNQRNWDYRYCWLRDAAYAVMAFHNLGHFEEMEGFLKFLLGVLHREDRLRPVYRVDDSLPLPEVTQENWAGYAGSRPVRAGNQAAEHVQNDVYGEVILALTPIFLDERFRHLRTPDTEALMASLGRYCAMSVDRPDAGLWEIRDGWRIHSFTNLMCWAGLDRICTLRERGFLLRLDYDPHAARDRARDSVRAGAVEGILGNGPGDGTLDASLLQLPLLRFPDEDLSRRTVDAVREALSWRGKDDQKHVYLYRYLRQDDFGNPHSAFVLCSFWLVQALARVGRLEDAREALDEILASANGLGLISEHFDPAARQQLGNFPQVYSHVGLINAAFAVSPPWSDIL